MEVLVFTCTFTALMTSVSVKARLDHARLAAATPEQLRRKGSSLIGRSQKTTPNSFLNSTFFWIKETSLYSVNSQANLNVGLHGGMCNPAPTDLKELHPSSAQKPLWLQPWERIKWLDQLSSFWKAALHSTAHLYLKSAWMSHSLSSILQSKASEASKLQRADWEALLRHLIIIKSD